jgi:tripartite-type tricarboxylate transporter receptor subunit TctC
VAAFFGDIPGLITQVKGGKLKAIGLAAPEAASRSAGRADVRGARHHGRRLEQLVRALRPAKTPPEIVTALNRAVRAVLATPAVGERLAASGARADGIDASGSRRSVRQDTEKWGKLIRDKKITAE